MRSHVSNASIGPRQVFSLHKMTWEDINAPGAYVDVDSGDLYRIPKEAVLEGASPMIRKESASSSTFIQVSKDPYVTTYEARMVCAEHDVEPNF